MNGQVVQRNVNRTTGSDTSLGPLELHYYFGGMAVGDVSNNGSSNVDYATSIAQHRAVPPTTPGPFRNGGTTGTDYGDFQQAYDPINGLTYENTSSHYTVNDGDTLMSIAYAIWGDASPPCRAFSA